MDSSRFRARKSLQVRIRIRNMTLKRQTRSLSHKTQKLNISRDCNIYPVYAKRSSLLSRSSSKSGDEYARVENSQVLRLRSLSSRSCAESTGGDAWRQENDLGEPFGEKDGATMTSAPDSVRVSAELGYGRPACPVLEIPRSKNLHMLL